jgi:hypothetical protein
MYQMFRIITFQKIDATTTVIACPCNGSLVYYFEGKWYFEKDMLRVINLTAFS